MQGFLVVVVVLLKFGKRQVSVNEWSSEHVLVKEYIRLIFIDVNPAFHSFRARFPDGGLENVVVFVLDTIVVVIGQLT